ncbi:hypothetical protein BKI52_18200 [marine bacterium AO1-C]|nr:hypothetical protein BKI52_18200 [marine bacterium AO1-C]
MREIFSANNLKPLIKSPGSKKVLGQLNTEQLNFVKTAQLDAQHTTTEWLDFFDEVRMYDELKAIKRTNFMRLFGWITILMACFMAASLMMGTKNVVLFIISQLGFILLIPTLLITSRMAKRMRRKYFPDYFHTVIIPMLTALHEETAQNALIHLKTDLRHQANGSVNLETKNKYYRVFDWTVLQISGELLNATRFNLSVRIHHQLWYRKRKSKRRVFMNLRLEYPKKAHQYIYADLLDQASYKTKVKDKPKKHVLTLRRQLKFKDKFLDTYQYTDIPFSELVQMILNGYQATS